MVEARDRLERGSQARRQPQRCVRNFLTLGQLPRMPIPVKTDQGERW